MKIHYAKGTYKGRIVEQGFGQTKNGKAFFDVVFEVIATVDPVNGSTKPTDQSYKRRARVFLTEATFEKFAKGQLEAIGWNGSSLSVLDPNTPGYQDLTGNEFTAYCSHVADYKNPKESAEDWNISDGKGGGRGPRVEAKAGVASELDTLFNLSGGVATAPAAVAEIDEAELPF